MSVVQFCDRQLSPRIPLRAYDLARSGLLTEVPTSKTFADEFANWGEMCL
jgi:hypothetical protein